MIQSSLSLCDTLLSSHTERRGKIPQGAHLIRQSFSTQKKQLNLHLCFSVFDTQCAHFASPLPLVLATGPNNSTGRHSVT